MIEKLIKFSENYNYKVEQDKLDSGNRIAFFHKENVEDVIVLIHGLGNSYTYGNQKFIQKCIEKDLNVFCFDLDGHSHDKKDLLSRSSIENALDPVIEYIDAMGAYNIHLIGYSLGSYIASRYVSLNPYIASTLHLVAPMGQLNKSIKAVCMELFSATNKTVIDSIREWGLSELTPALGKFRRSKFPLNHKEDNIHDAIYSWLREDEENGVFDRPVNIAGSIIYGSLDLVCPLEGMSLWKERFPLLKTFIEIGARHTTLPMVDADMALLEGRLEGLH